MHAQHQRHNTALKKRRTATTTQRLANPYTTMFILNICLPLSETSILPNFICYEKKRREAGAGWNNNNPRNNNNNGIINYYYWYIYYYYYYNLCCVNIASQQHIIIILLQEQGQAICTKASANVPSSLRQHISLSSQDLKLDSKVGKQRRQR